MQRTVRTTDSKRRHDLLLNGTGRIVSERKSFLMRVDPRMLDALQRWANDDLRSLNSQIEFLLRDALKRAGRAPKVIEPAADAPGPSTTPPRSSSPPQQD
jgi:hypothetical protein